MGSNEWYMKGGTGKKIDMQSDTAHDSLINNQWSETRDKWS